MTSDRPRWDLICFDLDGTLVRGTSISQFLAPQLGHVELLAELERGYFAYEVTNAQIADAVAGAYRGRTRGWVAETLADVPCIGGIGRTIGALRDAGIPAVLATVGWRFAAEAFAERHGFAAASGTEMAEEPPGTLAGRVSRYFDEHDKCRFVEAYCAERGLSLERCVAVGDARSDIPLFEAVGYSIALNATPEARAAATVTVDTDDLTSVLDLIL